MMMIDRTEKKEMDHGPHDINGATPMPELEAQCHSMKHPTRPTPTDASGPRNPRQGGL